MIELPRIYIYPRLVILESNCYIISHLFGDITMSKRSQREDLRPITMRHLEKEGAATVFISNHATSQASRCGSSHGAVIQLKGTSAQNEALSVISEAGMRGWFRDLFILKALYQRFKRLNNFGRLVR